MAKISFDTQEFLVAESMDRLKQISRIFLEMTEDEEALVRIGVREGIHAVERHYRLEGK